MKIRLESIMLFAVLAGCASKPLPPVPLFTFVEPYVSPTPDMAQIVFLSPADAPTPADTNALYELEGDRRTLVAALAAHTGSFNQVKPGHHVFMTYGHAGHLLEADVEGGARYYVLLRSDGKGELTPLPMRMTEGRPHLESERRVRTVDCVVADGAEDFGRRHLVRREVVRS